MKTQSNFTPLFLLPKRFPFLATDHSLSNPSFPTIHLVEHSKLFQSPLFADHAYKAPELSVALTSVLF